MNTDVRYETGHDLNLASTFLLITYNCPENHHILYKTHKQTVRLKNI
jgi:hypothetical protein